jgi:sulfatase maturation enzyme AslB (radical SAM superfamily)
VNTAEIVRVDDVVWQIIGDSCCSKEDVISKYTPEYKSEEIGRAYDEICTARDSEHLFLNDRPEISMPLDKAAIRDAIDSERGQLLLNVTDRCNFRCDYCPYTRQATPWRPHGERDMSWETARAAIDDFLAHCRFVNEEPDPQPASGSGSPPAIAMPSAISFYGGEPLLNFRLIRKCVEYAREKKRKGQRLCFSVATNGYLLKGEVAKFLATHGFFVRVSLDGPASVHDQHRRTAAGLPTWSTVVENVKAFYRDYPDGHLPSFSVTTTSYGQPSRRAKLLCQGRMDPVEGDGKGPYRIRAGRRLL